MKSITGVKAILEGVTGFENKVVYYEWPINEAPPLPFVCYYSPNEQAFAADNINYFSAPHIIVELYTKVRDLATEALFEDAFRAAGLYFTKETEYLDDERCQMTVFNL